MNVEWTLHDRRPDFIAEGFDCAIQVGQISDPSVVSVLLAEIPRIVVAAPELQPAAEQQDVILAADAAMARAEYVLP